jgi:hypothetical protein
MCLCHIFPFIQKTSSPPAAQYEDDLASAQGSARAVSGSSLNIICFQKNEYGFSFISGGLVLGMLKIKRALRRRHAVLDGKIAASLALSENRNRDGRS